jgi:hypothetical protein
MRHRYEQLIEYIINDQTEEAKALFHNLVVEKSREIYNDLVAEEMEEEEMEESAEEEEEEMEESYGMEMETGDETDDMMSDISADHEGMGDEDDMDHMHHMGHEGGDGDIEDRVMDLEDALDQLKAEFEQLMADEEGEPEHHDGVNDPDFDHMDDEEEMEMEGEEEPEEGMVREYVEKVREFYKGDTGEGKAVGANSGSITGTTNTKSIVAGKNDMGGSTQNIAKGGSESAPDGTSAYKAPSNQYSKGKGNLPGAGKFENVPGAKAGNAFSNAKKPTSSEPGGTNDKSILKAR